MRLENKIAIITGAGSGIGRETALLFALEGAIKKEGGEGFFALLDTTDREQTEHVAKKTLDKYGRIDVLLNNAGIIQDALIVKMTEEQWDRVINVNLKGVFNCIQAVAGTMISQGSGSIINASSIVGIFGNVVMKEKTPLRMLGEPLDVANAYFYLASDESKFVTGAVLSVDGGLVL